MMQVKDKHITIIGAARSGLSAAALLKRQGAQVFVSEFGTMHDYQTQFLNQLEIPFEDNGHTDRALECDFIVLSPGVPDTAPIVKKAVDQNIDLFSELEIASWFCKGKIIAITGSNGKTTVTNWIAHTFETAERPYIIAGNVGVAFSSIVEQTTEETTVILEVSSFQLDHIRWFKPDIAVLLNITPDHLDRYQQSFDLYANAKFRIFENLDGDQVLVYGFDDARINKQVLQNGHFACKTLPFSTKQEVEEGIFVRNDEIIFKQQSEEVLMHTSDVGLPGHHNLSNGLATAIAARAAEIGNEAIRESLSRFEGVEHRLEFVRELDGVKYINDSKATNVNAVWFALDSFSMPMTLILGGRDKGNNYKELADQLREKVHTVVAIGEGRPQIKEQLTNVIPYLIEAETMEEAVNISHKKAKRGEIVLLSPACSSFDMFDNFEHRGEIFKQLVNSLA
jgi:UDP-N-acetylmuramoylalanine--D-glutamate ligase